MTNTPYTPYPSRKIRRICACTHQRPRRKQDPIRRIQKKAIRRFNLYENKIFWKISNVVPTPRNPQYAVSKTLDTPLTISPNVEVSSFRLLITTDDILVGVCFDLYEDVNEHLEKVLKIMDLFHIPNLTIDQVILRAFPMSLIGAAIPTTPKIVHSRKRKTLKEAYYTQFGSPFQGWGYRATALGFYQRNNANPSYQERRQSMEETLRKFMGESAKRHEENSNLIKEIRASTNASIRNQGASIKTFRDPNRANEQGEVIEEFKARNDARKVSNFFGYPSDCDHDKKIRIDCAHNLKEVGINARRFEGMITIHNGNEEVTYQMVRSHPRFKHHTNDQCNKISPLLKVSKEDKMNGILHSYQKLKSFYKGVFNLGSKYVQDAKMEEWLTRGDISVHEME
ncbi:hypothetical protein Tco_0418739 [Tanacetum coccineum]